MLSSLSVSIIYIFLNPLLLECPNSLSDIVLLSALKTSLYHPHLLLLGFFDTNESLIHEVALRI